MSAPTADWSFPTRIRFGVGRIAELGDACLAAGMARPLLITDRGLAALPITAQALDILDAAGLGRHCTWRRRPACWQRRRDRRRP